MPNYARSELCKKDYIKLLFLRKSSNIQKIHFAAKSFIALFIAKFILQTLENAI